MTIKSFNVTISSPLSEDEMLKVYGGGGPYGDIDTKLQKCSNCDKCNNCDKCSDCDKCLQCEKCAKCGICGA